MVIKTGNSALDIVQNYYQNYGAYARELKETGRKIIGYVCALTPVEIIDAAGLIPFRLKGDAAGQITKADTQMETLICTVVRSIYDTVSKGKFNFIEGLIIPHACDSFSRTYPVWKYTLDLPYTHFINLPHGDDQSCLAFFQSELAAFRKSLGKFTGKEISDEALKESVNKYNNYRAVIRALYELRKSDPPPVTGSEITRILVAGMGLPVAEATALVSNATEEIRQREKPVTKKPRLMLVGAEIDNPAVIELIEQCGADIVTDDLCPGLREYGSDTPVTDNPLEGLAQRYLLNIKCGRAYRERKGTVDEYYEERFGQIGRRIKDFNADGVILYFYKFCDPYGFEVPAMKSYIASLQKPVFYLEGDYLISDPGRVRTRIQAFIEQLVG